MLILDEATSALDSQSESLIEKALQNLIKDKTVIAVAHRLSTLHHMNRIIVLDNGKLPKTALPPNSSTARTASSANFAKCKTTAT